MLRSIGDLSAYVVEGGRVTFQGSGGCLELSLHSPRLVLVQYRFDVSVVPPEADEPHPGLFASGSPPETALAWGSVEDRGTEFSLRHDTIEVRVEKASALVSVFERGLLVHGGSIGDKDTVIPRQPLRVQGGGGPGGLRGKFNFRLEAGDSFFGLGEKSGLLDKRGRSFKLFNRDALGYDAATSDPLYKSVPFLIKANRASGALCGLFFPNLAVEEVNLGVESAFYYHVTLADGPFSYFVMTGGSYRELLGSYCGLTGLPALPPLFSFGYLTSSMGYTDPDDAPARVLDFFDKVEEADIPCEGMYFSSGYARADSGQRHTFVWNRRKFPDPAGFLMGLLDRGYRVCCNVKPGILSSHPWYAKVAASGVFIPDAEGRPLESYYWGNTASFVDFSREEGFEWWVKELTSTILDMNVSGVWNDNNEFEVEDESLPVQRIKKILPVMMAKASYDALRRARPGKRPWLISRAGYAGLQRYARTWTGDNVSDYDTMRYNIAMGMNLGLSGLPIYGHDLGGFYGPHPDEELLLRWCQSAVFQPRFVMHSWKPDGGITEPWSFPGALAAIRLFIRERYRFLPYLYDLAIRAHETGIPMESPLALDFPGDAALFYDCLDRMVGDAILVPGPPERGAGGASLRFPRGADWFDPTEGLAHRGGAALDYDYPADAVRCFFRCGSVVATAARIGSVGKVPSTEDVFLVFPPLDKDPIISIHSLDDGESDFAPGSHWRHRMEFEGRGEGRQVLGVRLERRAAELPFERIWTFRVPDGFTILDAEGRPSGGEIRLDLSEAPEALRLVIEGSYRIAGA